MSEEGVRHIEPRWPAALALLSIGALYYALPSALTVGPDWLVLVLVAALAIPTMISHRQGNWRLSKLLGYAASSVVTLSVAISLVLLIWRLPEHKETPAQLLRSAGAREMGEDQWRPGFVDYLFLAFNTSTAFSPTDVPVLSRWAKILMMLQATISLGTIAILAARAVNIL